MGNVVGATQPREILPVHSYVADAFGTNPQRVESLGSTRFMKVARVHTKDGVDVAKVFIAYDDRPLDSAVYRPFVEMTIGTVAKGLASAPNCLPFRRLLMNAQNVQSAILTRPYHKYTLYDRLATHPFLTDLERHWFIYQMFRGLAQCHEAGICHGDLKTQNMVVTSSGWLLLTDFASFKPTCIPVDNPACFTFFFDTSRRQTCYLAPERFCSTSKLPTSTDGIVPYCTFFALTPAMDMWSAGCVLYELLSDGRPAFSYSDMVAFVESHDLTTATDALMAALRPHVPAAWLPLLERLLHPDPSRRPTAAQVLEDWTGVLWPSAFSGWIWKWLERWRGGSREPSASMSVEHIESSANTPFGFGTDPDSIVTAVSRDESTIIARLSANPEDHPNALLFVSLLTANLRALRTLTGLTEAMRLLVEFSALLSADLVLNRALPYLVHVIDDRNAAPSAKAAAIRSIADMLAPISPSSQLESQLFIVYLLPRLQGLISATDCAPCIRLALISELGRLATTALRFWTKGQELRSTATEDGDTVSVPSSTTAHDAALERNQLCDQVENLFVALISSDVSIRHAWLLRGSVEPLCQFFRSTGRPHVVECHVLTFMNTKDGWRIRAALFDALPVCIQRFDLLLSLLEQGVHDSEEWVAVQAVRCIRSLIALQQQQQQSDVTRLLDVVAPLLAHPNYWIRWQTIALVVELHARWSLADVHCRLLPRLGPHFTTDRLIHLTNREVVEYHMKPPLPRTLWTLVVSLDRQQTDQVVSFLDYWIATRADGGSVSSQRSKSVTRLYALGLAGEEAKLYAFRAHLLKMAEFRASCSAAALNQQAAKTERGVLDLSSDALSSVRRFVHHYATYSISQLYDSRVVGTSASASSSQAALTDATTPVHDEQNNSNGLMVMSRRDLLEMRTWCCTSAMSRLLAHKSEQQARRQSTTAALVSASVRSAVGAAQPPDRVRGRLVAHLHEHEQAVTKLALHPAGGQFASSSLDSTVRVWSLSGTRTHAALRSDAVYRHGSTTDRTVRTPINSVAWLADGARAAAATDDGFVVILDAPRGLSPIHRLAFHPELDGAPTILHAVGQHLYAITHHGAVFCIDTRVGREGGGGSSGGVSVAWRRELIGCAPGRPNPLGLIISAAVDGVREHWLTLAGSSGGMALFDVRYKMEVTQWSHPANAPTADGTPTKRNVRTMAVWADATRSDALAPQVWAASHSRNELSLYSLDNRQRTHVLWADEAPPLEYADGDKRRPTTALAVCPRTQLVYAGDSNGTLRCWNVNDPRGCSYLSGRYARDTGPAEYCIKYERSNVASTATGGEMCVVLHECKPTLVSLVASTAELKTWACHRSVISDLLVAAPDLLVSASRDGVIKLWK